MSDALLSAGQVAADLHLLASGDITLAEGGALLGGEANSADAEGISPLAIAAHFSSAAVDVHLGKEPIGGLVLRLPNGQVFLVAAVDISGLLL